MLGILFDKSGSLSDKSGTLSPIKSKKGNMINRKIQNRMKIMNIIIPMIIITGRP